MPNPFQIPDGLRRNPIDHHQLLAWDSADLLALEHLSTQDLKDKKILLINDRFGALALPLRDFAPTVYTDSYLSDQAICRNEARLYPSSGDGLTPKTIHRLHDLSEIQGHFDFVVLRLPKNNRFLEDILSHLVRTLSPHSRLICATMVKHQSRGAIELLKKWIGAPIPSLAKKKARLIFCGPPLAALRTPLPPLPYPKEVHLPGFKKPFLHPSNLFSSEGLDIGTRFFLEHLPQGEFRTILDLGCANGIVGFKAKLLHPQAKVIFTDESYQAVQSARLNYQRLFTDPAEFHWTNGCEGVPQATVDLVLCNPPFHQEHTLGLEVAVSLFKEAKRVLRPGGELRVIGNSHLRYQDKLHRIFRNCREIARNSKFTILEGQTPKI